jgi:regulator of protease activity HflC (stomatin/prohibitin superfamily)
LTGSNPEQIKAMVKKAVLWAAGGVFALIVMFSAFFTIKSTERGVLSTFGKVEKVLQPGLHAKIPFVQSVEKYTLVPQEYRLVVPVNGDAAALSKDNQSLGYTAVIQYQYNENEILKIARQWSRDRLVENIKNEFIFATKSAVAAYSSSDVASNQLPIAANIKKICIDYFTSTNVPVVITNTTIDSWDWSDDFDTMIKETMKKQQEVKQKEAEVEIATQEAQKTVVSAQAALDAAKLTAESTRVTADAEAYKNRQISQNAAQQQAQWKHEEEMARLEKWDGHYVPTNNYGPIPVQAGSIQGR